MPDYIEKLKSDLIEQFRGKPNIESLVEAIGQQLNELADFYQQLVDERSVAKAEGVQLDGVGDIVVLTRSEADALVRNGAPLLSELDDETYRQRILFKILKNTCDCTYSDIRKAIEMMWTGPTLRYVEDPAHPATLVFEFDASPDLTESEMSIPFIKAGGVGLIMQMQKKDQLTMYYGLPIYKVTTTEIDCLVPVLVAEDYFTEELEYILTDETGAWLVE